MPELRRELSGFDLTMVAIGSTIGAGIFLTPAVVAGSLPTAPLILSVWILGGLLAVAGALTFAELGTMMPRAGGVYVYLTEAFGGLVGFLYGWAYFLVVNTGSLAALSIAFATYLGYFVPLGPSAVKLVAIGGIVVLTIVNVLGVRAGGLFSDVFTVLKLVGIVGLIGVGLVVGTGASTNFTDTALPPQGLGTAFAVALIGVLFSYGGWHHATFVAGEAKNPQRTLPVAMIIGAGTVMAIYLLTNVAYLRLMSPAEMASSSRLGSEAAERVFGTAGGTLVTLVIFISTFGTAGIYTLTAPRIYFAMARDGAFFRRVAEVHPRFHTPAVAIVLQSAWVIVLILFWGTFESLISYVTFTDGLFFALAALSVLVLRARQPHAARPYRTLGYPITPLFFVAVQTWFVLSILVARPAQAWAGLLLLALGVPVYYYWRARHRRAAPFAL
jgi:APA family basic amino acid/polyamine antiporter